MKYTTWKRQNHNTFLRGYNSIRKYHHLICYSLVVLCFITNLCNRRVLLKAYRAKTHSIPHLSNGQRTRNQSCQGSQLWYDGYPEPEVDWPLCRWRSPHEQLGHCWYWAVKGLLLRDRRRKGRSDCHLPRLFPVRLCQACQGRVVRQFSDDKKLMFSDFFYNLAFCAGLFLHKGSYGSVYGLWSCWRVCTCFFSKQFASISYLGNIPFQEVFPIMHNCITTYIVLWMWNYFSNIPMAETIRFCFTSLCSKWHWLPYTMFNEIDFFFLFCLCFKKKSSTCMTKSMS